MPNQSNFPDKLTNIQDQRPSRIAQKDLQLIQKTNADGVLNEKEIVFGQTLKDVAELYVYDELSNVVAHVNIRPNDPAIRLLTFTPQQADIGVGEDSTPDNVQIDLVSVLNRLDLAAGRYSVSINFFRDEVGQEFVDDTAAPADRQRGSRLYIADISPSRTELRLGAVKTTDATLNEIREFVDPSVPRFIAQGLVDQTFGTALDVQQGEYITVSDVESQADVHDAQAGTTGSLSINSRVDRAKLTAAFISFVQASLPHIRDRVLDSLAARIGDLEIQSNEVQQLVADGTRTALLEMVRAGQLDARFQLVDSIGNPVR